jgi:hypothetical protein
VAKATAGVDKANDMADATYAKDKALADAELAYQTAYHPAVVAHVAAMTPAFIARETAIANAHADYQTAVAAGRVTMVNTTAPADVTYAIAYAEEIADYEEAAVQAQANRTNAEASYQVAWTNAQCAATFSGISPDDSGGFWNSVSGYFSLYGHYWTENLDGLQTWLDLAGLIPGFGEPFDAANAVINAARGNWGQASLSAISVVPVLGDAIGKGGKLGVYIFKSGDEVVGAAAGAARHLNDIPAGGGADDFVTAFRGDRPNTTVIKSHAAQEGGYAQSQRLIEEGNLDDLFRAHAADSSSPASPFVSVSTDRRVAEFFAGADGVVTELRIPASRATPNIFNEHYVPAGDGGSLIPEMEFLIPNYIRPSEIIRRTAP